MSELINNNQKRKDLLKHMIRQLHEGVAPEAVRKQLISLLGQVPYNDVVTVEQELINEGFPQEAILKLCDIHSLALKGTLDHTGAKTAPAGHPVDTFIQENRALQLEAAAINELFTEIRGMKAASDASVQLMEVRKHLNNLMDVDKHYVRKENLLFPFLEKHEITGPPAVMWGKHDETRALLKGAIETLQSTPQITAEEANSVIDLIIKPAVQSVEEMIYKEEEILFPMCLDTLSDNQWYAIYKQSPEIGFCLYDPTDKWEPAGVTDQPEKDIELEKISLPSGSLTIPELNALLNTIPFDLTFVDKDDTVRYFTQGAERIFARNRAILGRKVQLCHPPSSVHIVQRILDDFHAGRQDKAAFWINMGGRFIHIEYFALRDENGGYLGTLEVSQDLTAKRKLEGEQRLLDYSK